MATRFGTFDYYKWREDEIEAMRARNLNTERMGRCDKLGRATIIKDKEDNTYVVKSVDAGSREAINIAKLLKLHSTRNYTVPAELVECSETCLIVMPYLYTAQCAGWLGLERAILFQFFDCVLEGVAFMHENHIAHVDICSVNMVFSDEPFSVGQLKIAAFKPYFIDFGSSRCLTLGPGHGAVIHDYVMAGGHYRPPEGMEEVDPYAYDVFSVGKYFHEECSEAAKNPKIVIPWSLWQFVALLLRTVPEERPSIEQAGALWSDLQREIHTLETMKLEDASKINTAEVQAWNQLLTQHGIAKESCPSA